MRGAPPVQMACGRDARWAAAVALVLATSTATLVGWLAWQAAAGRGLSPLAALGTWLIVAPATWIRMMRDAPRLLAWDGQAWMLSSSPCVVEVMIDLGDWMLVRVTESASGRPHWLPLALRATDPHSHLRRAALHAHGGPPPAAAA